MIQKGKAPKGAFPLSRQNAGKLEVSHTIPLIVAIHRSPEFY